MSRAPFSDALRRARAWARAVRTSDVGTRIAGGAAWSLSGAVVSRLLAMAGVTVVARILGATEYGQLGSIQATVSLFGVFAGSGLGLTATKHVAELRRTNPARAGAIISLVLVGSSAAGALISFAMWLAAPRIAADLLASATLVQPIRIGCALTWFAAMNAALSGALTGFEAFRSVATVSMVTGLFSLASISVSVMAWGLRGAIASMALSMAMGCVLNAAALRREMNRHAMRISLGPAAREARILWSFSLPSTLAGAMNAPAMWLASLLLVNAPGGFREMGLFTAANQWGTLIGFIPAAVGTTVVPMLAAMQEGERNPDFSRTLRYLLGANLVVAAACALPVALMSRMIMRMYGPDFVSGATTLAIVALTAIAASVASVVGYAVMSRGRIWLAVLLNALWASVMLSGCVLLRGRGAVGLASAIGVAYAFHVIFSAGVLRRLLRGNAMRVPAAKQCRI